MPNSKKTVFVGMSGGVDSSVSAKLLKDQGYHVVGVYMKNWSRDLPGMKCPWADDLADAKRIATKLDIDFKIFDFEKELNHLNIQFTKFDYQERLNYNVNMNLFYASLMVEINK